VTEDEEAHAIMNPDARETVSGVVLQQPDGSLLQGL
jgi:hypothetical protein